MPATAHIPWPAPDAVVVHAGYYDTPAGPMARVTSVLNVIGTSKPGLIRWAANEERSAVLEAAADVLIENLHDGPADFVSRVETRLGAARQHQKKLAQAADIGTHIHQAIRAWLLSPDAPQEPLPDQAEWALMSFQDWWRGSGLSVVRSEQPVWSPDEKYAGTIDLVADHPIDGVGIVDFKSSKAVYDTHHIQVSAYVHAAEQHADIRWAKIVRVPKITTDPSFEVKPLGAMWDRQLTRTQLMDCFRAALVLHRALVQKP